MSVRIGLAVVVLGLVLAGCNGTPIGKPPELTSIGQARDNAGAIVTAERAAIAVPPAQPARYSYQQASLWGSGPENLLGDRRASRLGDILTVLIEIDEQAEMRNSTQRTRTGSEEIAVDSFLGLDSIRPPGLRGLNPNLGFDTNSNFRGQGNTRRNEKLTLRVAATVVDVLPNGHLVIQGDQEVRVNNELRDLQIAGIVQPQDISRYNIIEYDRIAGARIIYGGRGQLTTAQQPRWGQQVVDTAAPF